MQRTPRRLGPAARFAQEKARVAGSTVFGTDDANCALVVTLVAAAR